MKNVLVVILVAASFCLGLVAGAVNAEKVRASYERTYLLSCADHVVTTVGALKRLRKERVDEAIEALENSLDGNRIILESGGDAYDDSDTNIARALRILRDYRSQLPAPTDGN